MLIIGNIDRQNNFDYAFLLASMAEGTPFRKFLFIQQDKARATVEARRVLIGKNVVMIMVFEQIDDNSEKSQLCVGASALQRPRQLEK